MVLPNAPTGSEFTLKFFTPAEASTIDALIAQILPDEEGSPGAHGAGVTEYIDHSLAGYLHELQPVYRDGLQALAEYTQARFGGPFRFLDNVRQEAVVAELDRLVLSDPEAFLGDFFRIVREHTIQGFFGDPAYGGNHDAAGWRLIGFPGAQHGYSVEQLEPGFDATEIPILTVDDLYRHANDRRRARVAASPPGTVLTGSPRIGGVAPDSRESSVEQDRL